MNGFPRGQLDARAQMTVRPAAGYGFGRRNTHRLMLPSE